MRHLVWFAVVVLLALTFVPVSDLQAAGDRRTGARKGLAAGTTHSAVRLKATTPGKDAVVFELLVRDLCVIMVKRTELVVPCSEWRPLDKTGPERAQLVKGKVYPRWHLRWRSDAREQIAVYLSTLDGDKDAAERVAKRLQEEVEKRGVASTKAADLSAMRDHYIAMELGAWPSASAAKDVELQPHPAAGGAGSRRRSSR